MKRILSLLMVVCMTVVLLMHGVPTAKAENDSYKSIPKYDNNTTIAPAKDQRDIGTCWAFSTIGALALYIKYKSSSTVAILKSRLLE